MITHSNNRTLNDLSRALVNEALLPGERPEDLNFITPALLLAAGLRLQMPDTSAEARPGDIRRMIRELRREIDDITQMPYGVRGQVLDDRIPQEILRVAGADSGTDAARQAADLWNHLDGDAKSTLALALLMQRTARAAAWSPMMAVLGFALDPHSDEIPRQPWE